MTKTNNTTTTRVKSRTEETRDMETREEEYTFTEPNALEIPEAVLNRYTEQGMVLRWIRVAIRGQDDIANVGKKTQTGWKFILPTEVPEMASTSFVREGGRYNGTVCRGDLALAKLPKQRYVARQKFYEKKAGDLMDAVNSQLMRNNNSRMPISNTSKSTQTVRGKTAAFQE